MNHGAHVQRCANAFAHLWEKAVVPSEFSTQPDSVLSKTTTGTATFFSPSYVSRETWVPEVPNVRNRALRTFRGPGARIADSGRAHLDVTFLGPHDAANAAGTDRSTRQPKGGYKRATGPRWTCHFCDRLRVANHFAIVSCVTSRESRGHSYGVCLGQSGVSRPARDSRRYKN